MCQFNSPKEIAKDNFKIVLLEEFLFIEKQQDTNTNSLCCSYCLPCSYYKVVNQIPKE
jgi:hypothetical protein